MLINERKLRSIVRSVIKESIGGSHPIVSAMSMLADEISSQSGGRYTLHVSGQLETWPAVSKGTVACIGRLEGPGTELSVKMTPRKVVVMSEEFDEMRTVMSKNIDAQSCDCSSLASEILAKAGSGFGGKFSENNPALRSKFASHAPVEPDFDF